MLVMDWPSNGFANATRAARTRPAPHCRLRPRNRSRLDEAPSNLPGTIPWAGSASRSDHRRTTGRCELLTRRVRVARHGDSTRQAHAIRSCLRAPAGMLTLGTRRRRNFASACTHSCVRQIWRT